MISATDRSTASSKRLLLPRPSFPLKRLWRSGDQIDIAFDFSLQYDRRFNTVDPDRIPALDAKGLSGRTVGADQWFAPMLLMELKAVGGQTLRLCDFGSAGIGGSPYRAWLDVGSCAKTGFSKSNPRRSSSVS